MELPQITIPEPVVIPPVAEKFYLNGYIVGMRLETRDTAGAEQRLALTLRPYNKASADLYPDSSRDTVHDITSVWNEVERCPLFAQVLGGIVTVTNLLVQERMLLNQLGLATEEEKPAVQAELLAVRQSLGMME